MGKGKVIGMDPSLRGFAVCVLEREESGYISRLFHEWNTTSVKGLAARRIRIRKLVDKAVEVVKEEKPDLIMIEGYAYSAKGSSGLSLAELGGVLRDQIIPLAPMTVEVPPTVAKKFATGKGNAGKVEVVSTLSRRYDLNFSSDNKADAFGLAMLGLLVLGLEPASNNHQMQTADTVRDLIQQETDYGDTARRHQRAIW